MWITSELGRCDICDKELDFISSDCNCEGESRTITIRSSSDEIVDVCHWNNHPSNTGITWGQTRERVQRGVLQK
jgi:hypothetical protein